MRYLLPLAMILLLAGCTAPELSQEEAERIAVDQFKKTSEEVAMDLADLGLTNESVIQERLAQVQVEDTFTFKRGYCVNVGYNSSTVPDEKENTVLFVDPRTRSVDWDLTVQCMNKVYPDWNN